MRDSLAGGGQVGRERLLGKHVLAGLGGTPDQLDTNVRPRRDVDDLHLVVVEQLVDGVVRRTTGKRSRIPAVASATGS